MYKEITYTNMKTETLLAHMIKNQKINVLQTNSALGKLMGVAHKNGIEAPDVFEIVYSFKTDKNSILISVINDIFFNTKLRSDFLFHCKIVLFDNTGDFSKRSFFKILKEKLLFEDDIIKAISNNLLILKSYSLTDYVLNLMKIYEMSKIDKSIKAIIVDGSNDFFLEDKGVKNFKDINWGRKHAKKIVPKPPDLVFKAFDLLNKFIQKGIGIIEIRLDHFYKENALRYENGQYFLHENYVKNLFYVNNEVKISSLYLLNKTYNNFVNSTIHRNDIEYDIVEIKGAFKYSNYGDKKSFLVLYSVDDYKIDIKFAGDISNYKTFN